MDFFRIFRTAVVVGLGVAAAACQQSRQSPGTANAGRALATETWAGGERFDAYIGATFSEEQKALALKAPELDAPSF